MIVDLFGGCQGYVCDEIWRFWEKRFEIVEIMGVGKVGRDSRVGESVENVMIDVERCVWKDIDEWILDGFGRFSTLGLSASARIGVTWSP